MEARSRVADVPITVGGMLTNRRVYGISRFQIRGAALVPKLGGRWREVSVPEGHSFACEGEAAVEGTSETRSHAVGQSSDKRTLLRVGRGQPVGLYAPLHLAGLSRNTSVNCATTVGRESPEPTPAFSV